MSKFSLLRSRKAFLWENNVIIIKIYIYCYKSSVYSYIWPRLFSICFPSAIFAAICSTSDGSNSSTGIFLSASLSSSILSEVSWIQRELQIKNKHKFIAIVWKYWKTYKVFFVAVLNRIAVVKSLMWRWVSSTFVHILCFSFPLRIKDHANNTRQPAMMMQIIHTINSIVQLFFQIIVFSILFLW